VTHIKSKTSYLAGWTSQDLEALCSELKHRGRLYEYLGHHPAQAWRAAALVVLASRNGHAGQAALWDEIA